MNARVEKKAFTGPFNKLSLMAPCHAAVIQEPARMTFTYRDLSAAVDRGAVLFLIQLTNAFQRTFWLIKSKTTPDRKSVV